MSFNLSAGTLDTMAGIFSPSKRSRSTGGGGGGAKREQGGVLLGLAVASMFPKPAPLGGRYHPPSRRKQAFGGGSNAAVSGRAIATLDRTARRVPEVMVRITGRQHGAGHVLANFAYISRLGHGADKELALHTSEDEVIRDGQAMQELARDWHEWEVGDDARRKGATSLSMILSMPSGTDPERLKGAALDLAREQFANRSWVASLHVDRDHPHVHLTFARRDHDGRRFHPTRDDLFRYRQCFAQKLRDRGIEANATPAKARGVDPRHEPIAATKLRARGHVSTLDRSRSARDRRIAATEKSDPVRVLLDARDLSIRDAYKRTVTELRSSRSMVNLTVATSLQRFVDEMTGPEPNSIRAARVLAIAHDTGRPPPGPVIGDNSPIPDRVAAALTRSKAMRERIEARRADERPASSSRASDEPPSRSSLDRVDPRAADRPTAPPPLGRESDRIDEVMRQVQERARRARDRDRDPEKGGPRR